MIHKSTFPPLEIPQKNVLSYLFPANQTPSDDPIWIDAANPEKNLSPRQLQQWAKRLANGLDKQVAPGEAVLIFTPNHIFVPVAYLAIVGSCHKFSGANPAYTLTELEFQLKNTGAKLMLVHPSLLENATAAAQRVGLAKQSIFQFSDELCETLNDVPDWTKMIGSEAEAHKYSWKAMGKESAITIATINYSSGTTGLPKGVSVSHYNLIANVEQTIYMRDIQHSYHPANRPQERWIGFLPLYHAYGQLYACLMAVKLHFPVYIMKKFVYDEFLGTIQKFRITNLQTAPPILVMLNKRPENAQYDLSSVKHIICGGAPLSKELQNGISRKLSAKVVQGWGATEVTCGGLYVPGGCIDESGSVGLLSPNSECRLVGEDGQDVDEGEPGELYIRGAQVCLGYWRNKKATADTIDENGWLKTGDVAIMRKDWFWIVDRKKEMIKVNALQVAPAELEAVLLENEDILDAAVVGIALNDEEKPRAYVVLNNETKSSVTEKQIQDWMASRVAKHKRLTGGVKFMDEIPRLASGKIVRKIVREWAKEDAKHVKQNYTAKL